MTDRKSPKILFREARRHDKMVAAGKKAWKTRIANLRKRKPKRKSKGQVVGFYKKDGKTKPITKPVAQSKRQKMMKGGKQFKCVKPLYKTADFQYLAGQFEEQYPFKDFKSVNDENFKHVLGEWPENANIPKEIRGTVRKAILFNAKNYYQLENSRGKRSGRHRARQV